MGSKVCAPSSIGAKRFPGNKLSHPLIYETPAHAHLSMMSASSCSLASRLAAAARLLFRLLPPPEDSEPLPVVEGSWCSILTATAVECHSAAYTWTGVAGWQMDRVGG